MSGTAPGRAANSLSVDAIATRAGELDLATGFEHSMPDVGNTSTWGIEYRQPFSEHWAASFTWLNEGHLVNHHRDGQAAQLWWRAMRTAAAWYSKPVWVPIITTTRRAPRPSSRLKERTSPFENANGWGVLASAALNWYFKYGWFALLRLNDIEAAGEVRSTALLLGVGHRFGEGYASRFKQPDAWSRLIPHARKWISCRTRRP